MRSEERRAILTAKLKQLEQKTLHLIPTDKKEGIMKATERQIITFENPPIDEIVCDIVFDPIVKLGTEHIGSLWERFKPDFHRIEDQSIMPPLFSLSEEYLNSRQIPPLPRIWFVHQNENEVIQMQYDRFIYNWRKRRRDDVYPGYAAVIGNFRKYLTHFEEFLTMEKLGGIVLKQYELVYTDLIFKSEGWETAADLEKVFSNFFSLKDQKVLSADIRNFHWLMEFGLPKDFGQLQLSIHLGQRLSDKREVIKIEFKAISNQPYQPISDWFNVAHKTIFDIFINLVSEEIQDQYWRRKS